MPNVNALAASGPDATVAIATDTQVARAAWEQVRDELAKAFPKIGSLIDEAKAEVLAFTAFPRAHWVKVLQ